MSILIILKAGRQATPAYMSVAACQCKESVEIVVHICGYSVSGVIITVSSKTINYAKQRRLGGVELLLFSIILITSGIKVHVLYHKYLSNEVECCILGMDEGKVNCL